MSPDRPNHKVVWLTHPFGNSNVRAVLNTLYSNHFLEKYFTTIAFESNSRWLRYCPRAISQELRRRSYELPCKLFACNPSREIYRQIAKKCRLSWGLKHESGFASVDAIWRSLDFSVSKAIMGTTSPPWGVYAYEDGALETFRAAKRLGVKCIYDLPIGYYRSARNVFEYEKKNNPEFFSILQGFEDSDEKGERKEEEVCLADRIISCSPFVRRTLELNGINQEKIIDVQFGSPLNISPKDWSLPRDSEGLRMLFVGRIDQRKGIGYLLRAIASLRYEIRRHVKLHLIGEMPSDVSCLLPYRHLFTHTPSCSHEKVLQIMKESDVLVLPTLFEGQALVVLEAMANGIPVLVSSASGADIVVREGIDGWVIEPHDELAIRERIEWMVENRASLPGMGHSAAERSRMFTWTNYGKNILKALDSLDH